LEKNGYTIFYEHVGNLRSYLELDSISYDRLRRRFRRIDSSDVHVDINLLQMVNQIENLYGKIEFDCCEYNTHFDSAYSFSKAVKIRKLDPIIVDYRNEVVIEKVIASESEKIVILFGAAHRKGMKRLLKEKQIAK
jgi:hypothetical protein